MRAIVKNKLERALESKGWVLLNESEKGFEYIKKYGEYGGVQSVRYNPENGFTSLDPGIPSYSGEGYVAAPVDKFGPGHTVIYRHRLLCRANK